MENLDNSHILAKKRQGRCSFLDSGQGRNRFSGRIWLVSLLLLFACQAAYPQTNPTGEGIEKYNNLKESTGKLIEGLGQLAAYAELTTAAQNLYNALGNTETPLESIEDLTRKVKNICENLKESAGNLSDQFSDFGQQAGDVIKYIQDIRQNGLSMSTVSEILKENGFGKMFTAPIGFTAGYAKSGLTIKITEIRSTREKAEEGAGNFVDFDATAEFQLPFSMFGGGSSTNIKFAGEKLLIAGSTNEMSKLKVEVQNNTIPMFNEKVTLVVDGESYVGIDCNGFRELFLKGQFIFDRGLGNAVNETGGDAGDITAEFSILASDLEDMIIQLTFLKSFKLKCSGDFIYTVTDAVVDLSTVRNAEDFVFPDSYRADFPDEDKNYWTGFALKKLSVKLPPEFSFGEKGITIEGRNMLFDEYGFSGWIAAQIHDPMVDNKSVRFSLQEIAVGIVQGELREGSLKGEIDIKALKDNNDKSLQLELKGSFHCNNNGEFLFDFGATLAADQTYHLPFTEKGKITLGRGCAIEFVKTEGQKATVNIKLNGNLTFEEGKYLNIEELRFEDLILSSREKYLRGGKFALNGNVGFGVGGLEMAITKFWAGYDEGSEVAYFGAEMNLKLIGDGLGASVKGGFKLYSDVKKDWEIIGLDVDNIGINVDFSVFTLTGEIEFFKNHPNYGNGFKGEIELVIKPIKISAFTEIKFGKTLATHEQEAFRYWYGKIGFCFGNGLLIFPPSVNLQCISGGVYTKMSPSGERYVNKKGVEVPEYIPNKNISFGFIVGVGLNVASDALITVDAELEMNFASGGGLNYIRIAGEIYLLSNKQDNLLNGGISLEYDHANEIFHMEAYVAVKNKIIETVPNVGITLHTQPGEWYFHLGTDKKPAEIKFAGLAKVRSYFMLGKVPSFIEPLDKRLISEFGFSGYETMPEAAGEGSGFAFGIALNVDAGFSKFVYADIKLSGGTDGFVVSNPNATCGGSHYRANIGAYFYMAAGAGIEVRDKKFEIIDIRVLADLRAEIPTPYYVSGGIQFRYKVLGGLIRGNANAKFQAGSTCSWKSNEPEPVKPELSFDMDTIIEMKKASGIPLDPDELEYLEMKKK